MNGAAKRFVLDWLTGLGSLSLLAKESVASLLTFKVSWRDFLYQIYFIGVKSQAVVIITGAFTGMVLAAQTYFQFHKVAMDTATLAVVSVSMCDELGPVLTALMVAGRVGAAMAAVAPRTRRQQLRNVPGTLKGWVGSASEPARSRPGAGPLILAVGMGPRRPEARCGDEYSLERTLSAAGPDGPGHALLSAAMTCSYKHLRDLLRGGVAASRCFCLGPGCRRRPGPPTPASQRRFFGRRCFWRQCSHR